MDTNWNFYYKYIEGDSTEDIAPLQEEFNIDALDIEDIVTDTQLSKVEVRQNYIYIALQFPRFVKEKKLIIEKELHFIIGENLFIVINKDKCKASRNFNLTAPDTLRSDLTAIEFFYETLDYLVTKTFITTTKFKQELQILEEQIFNRLISKDRINEIQKMKRNLINFYSITNPLQTTILEFQNKQSPLIHLQTTSQIHIEKLDDSLDKVKKINVLVSNFKEQINMISESNEALTARSINQSIKSLTFVSLIITIPNIVTSFFGMNVYFGFTEGNYIPLIAVSSLILVLLLVIMVRIKKYML